MHSLNVIQQVYIKHHKMLMCYLVLMVLEQRTHLNTSLIEVQRG